MFLGLQSSIHALQAQLDTSNRKTATTETILKNITEERDAAVSQLGVAWFTTEQLKGENESIRAENDDLKAQIAQLIADHENEIQKPTTREEAMCRELEKIKIMMQEAGLEPSNQDGEGLKEENKDLKSRLAQLTTGLENETQKWAANEEAMRRMLDQRAEVVKTKRKGRGLQSPSQENKSAPASQLENRQGIQGHSATQAKAPHHEEVDALFDFRPDQDIANGEVEGKHQAAEIDDSQNTDETSQRAAKEKGKDKALPTQSSANVDGISLDLTYLSFVDVSHSQSFLLSFHLLTDDLIASGDIPIKKDIGAGARRTQATRRNQTTTT